MSTAAKSTVAKKIEQEQPSQEDIRLWLVDYIARLLKLDANTIDTEARFESFGLDSASTVGLAGDLGEWLGRKVDPTLAYDYPTIDSLAAQLGR